MTGQTYTQENIKNGIGSWLAFSATNIVMYYEEEGYLLLGDRTKPAESIPEDGRWCLIGGFNGAIPGPAMKADVANAHLKAMLGIKVDVNQCSEFLPCEYDMSKITEPLNTPFGKLPIKREAFDRIVELTEEQKNAIVPQGKISAVRWVTEQEFKELCTIEGGEGLSFPHQIKHVRQAFELIKDKKSMTEMVTVGWIIS